MRLFKEINWALQEVNRFYSAYGMNISRVYLDETLKNSLIYAGEDIVINMLEYNFAELNNKHILLTALGHKMVSFATDKYDLSNKQKELVFQIYRNRNKSLFEKWLNLFSEEKLSIKRESIDIGLQQITEYMISLNIAIQNNREVIINEKYCYLLSESSLGITEEDLLLELDKNKKLGEIAESIALKFEVSRLKNMGKTDLFKKVQLISKIDVGAGFDIKSFEGVTSISYDRFIEVKSFNNKSIYITENEIQKAKILGEHYYLYLVNNNDITIIKNPYSKLREIAKSINCVLIKIGF